MDKLKSFVVLGVFSCALFQKASAQGLQTSIIDPYTIDNQPTLMSDVVGVCANKLLDERFYSEGIEADEICGEMPEKRYGYYFTTVSSPEYVKQELFRNKIVIINLKFDDNGNINASDQNQDDFISEIKKFIDDRNKTKLGGIPEIFGLQFGDDTVESQNILNKILASQVLSKALENNIVATASKFLKVSSQFAQFAYVGEIITTVRLS